MSEPRFETPEESAAREAEEHRMLLEALQRRPAPIVESAQVLADCTNADGTVDITQLIKAISRLCAERNKIAGISPRYKLWMKLNS